MEHATRNLSGLHKRARKVVAEMHRQNHQDAKWYDTIICKAINPKKASVSDRDSMLLFLEQFEEVFS